VSPETYKTWGDRECFERKKKKNVLLRAFEVSGFITNPLLDATSGCKV
jgi:hypothetical protein